MELYIRIVDGQPFEHPILGDNFKQAFPEIDVNNLPNNFAKFERIECVIQPSVYQVLQHEYAPNDIGWKDSWSIREMTSEEITNKQNTVKTHWANNSFQSWIFNETICGFEPPTAKPNDDKRYFWNEEQLAWVEAT
jgi:hypothetical protein